MSDKMDLKEQVDLALKKLLFKELRNICYEADKLEVYIFKCKVCGNTIIRPNNDYSGNSHGCSSNYFGEYEFVGTGKFNFHSFDFIRFPDKIMELLEIPNVG